MKAFEGFRTLLRARTPGVSDLERAVVRAEQEIAAASEKVEALRQGRRKALAGSDSERESNKAALKSAEDDLAYAGLYLEELRSRLEVARGKSADAERRRRYESAKIQGEAAERAVREEYPELAQGFVDLLAQVSSAALAVQAANADLPAGAEPLPDPEGAVRDIAGAPRAVVSERLVTLWADEITGLPLPESLQALVAGRGNFGFIRKGSERLGRHSERVVQKQFRRVEYRERRTVERGPRLFQIELPGLRVGEASYWFAGHARTPREILERLRLLAELRGKRRGKPQEFGTEVEYLPIRDAVDHAPSTEPETQEAEEG